MRTLSIVGLGFVASLSLLPSARADVTTQACLGNFDAFLTCPAGATRRGTECRVSEPKRGQGAGEHWSGSKRQGPAIFLRDKKSATPRVSFAASYKDHKKHGRVFHFDDQGRLSSWADVADNQYNGLSVTCLPDGRVLHVANFRKNQVVGVSRSWRASDGAFSFAMDHDAQGKPRPIKATPEMMKRPDYLCQPKRCDVTAKPDFSGVPAQP